MTGPEVARRAGMDWEYARRLWRALGMPEVDPETPWFDEVDEETLRSLQSMVDSGLNPDDVLQNARVYGQAFARIAEVDARLFRQLYSDADLSLETAVETLLQATFVQRQDALRRHMAVAVRDLVLSKSGTKTAEQAVGFVDLVDFTQLSMDLHADDLGDLISRFEEIAIESCAENGTRLVKMIGDAVMFVSPDPKKALATARSVVAAVRDDPQLFEARAGLDDGEVLASGGDYFGTPVNTASRITGFARSGTVVASEAFVKRLKDPSVTVSDLGSQVLRGVRPLQLFKLRDPEAPAPGGDAAEASSSAAEAPAAGTNVRKSPAKVRQPRRVALKGARLERKRARKKA